MMISDDDDDDDHDDDDDDDDGDGDDTASSTKMVFKRFFWDTTYTKNKTVTDNISLNLIGLKY